MPDLCEPQREDDGARHEQGTQYLALSSTRHLRALQSQFRHGPLKFSTRRGLEVWTAVLVAAVCTRPGVHPSMASQLTVGPKLFRAFGQDVVNN
mmetsp:Transcript_28481/g.75189  ORF Transcript_28481/g.75189 Transcript_28481/m.75189 type:complete len:94 (+) Transcript_28481:40-321(+)